MSKPSYVYVSYIRSTPEKVWQAITDREISKQYWGRSNRSDWKVGSSWEHQRVDGSNITDIVGQVVETRPPHHLVISWATPSDANDPGRVSRVSFDIEPQSAGIVRLTVTHSELEPGSQMERGITWGWPLVLASLKSFLETGEGLPIPKIKEAQQSK
ncbi:MAG TPA: SRPBCC family protein [Pseudolabrys sp.]|nr:SRPBCC family protein [Pseudolabrys sp.]